MNEQLNFVTSICSFSLNDTEDHKQQTRGVKW